MRIKFIINQSSGSQDHDLQIEEICRMLEERHVLEVFYTEKKDDATLATDDAIRDGVDLLIVSGGDGTVNEVANSIGDKRSQLPVAILSNGTVNDFSKFLEMPSDPKDFVEMIENCNTIDVDLGRINDSYFVNVAAMGTASNIAHEVDKEIKARFGAMAYYLQGLRKLPELLTESMHLRLTSGEFHFEGEAMLLVISNTKSIGGFTNLAPEADLSDGKFDVLLIKKTNFFSIADVFFKSLTGEHTENEDVLYFQTERLTVESLSQNEVEIDIDGEHGGILPIQFSTIPRGFRVVVNNKNKGSDPSVITNY